MGSVLRALRLLDLFERGRPEMSLAEFVRRSGYSKSTAYRLLLTLEEAGWLERGPGTALQFALGSVVAVPGMDWVVSGVILPEDWLRAR